MTHVQIITSKLIFFVFLSFLPVLLFSQETPERKKKGWTFGALPTIGYDTDIGFGYGGLVSVYDYGKESSYPKYRKMFRIEISRTTKGSGTNQLFFDSDRLLGRSGIRSTIDLSYLTEKTCDFYGFNGSEVNFDPSFMDAGSDRYFSRVFYRMERKLLRLAIDFRGRIGTGLFSWFGGTGFFQYKIGTVDLAQLNKGKKESEKLPDTALLFDQYVSWGLIEPAEADGGFHPFVKAGIVVDSRDQETNPAHGFWSELVLIMAPSVAGSSEYGFTRLALTHRQYFTLVPDRLTFACRLAFQGTVIGREPFYMLPYFYNSFPASTMEEGLGGAKSLRGIMRNRITGRGVIYGNAEFRWKFLRFVLWKQNFYFALSPFLDLGRVAMRVPVDMTRIPAGVQLADYFTGRKEAFHLTGGGGLHGALNENFVVAADVGYAFSRQDGGLGVYIGINWLF